MKSRCIALAFLAGIFYRLLLSLQGLYHTDSGFYNTFYQNIFTHPESVTHCFPYYLTGLTGGVWNLLFTSCGVLGFRILDILVLSLAIYFVYKIFERQIQDIRLVMVAIWQSFLFPCLITNFHHNTLTFLLISLSAWFYSKSLYSRQLLWSFLSAMMLSLCLFVSITNLPLTILATLPIIYAIAIHQKRFAFVLAGVLGSGLISGIATVLLTMTALGHVAYYLTGLSEYFNSVEDSFCNMFGKLSVNYFHDLVNIILQIFAIVGLGAVYVQVSRITLRWANALKILLVIISLVLISTSLPYLSSISLYTLLCAPIFYSITPKEDKLKTVFVLLASYLYPLGNEDGIVGIYHWTSALLVIPAIAGTYHTSRIIRKGVLILSLYIALVMMWKAFSIPYGENQPHYITLLFSKVMNIISGQ